MTAVVVSHIYMSNNFVELKFSVLLVPDFSWICLNFQVFIQIALKAMKMGSFLSISATTVIMTAQTLPRLNWYMFTCWQLCICCLATIIESVKRKTLRVAASSFYKDNFCPSKQRSTQQHSAALQSSPASARSRFWWSISDQSGRLLFLCISSDVISFCFFVVFLINFYSFLLR